MIAAALAGDRRALARLMSQVEAGGEAARAVSAEIFSHTGRAHIIGVTGAPGVGKSSLVNELARAYRRRGQTVGIVAVDPTSPFTGGALLGDRVRMNDLAGDAGVFIRSMATRGSLGGLAAATGALVNLLDAAGFEKIFVETVGAGQTEVDIAQAAHTVLVVVVPGLGDEIQAIKAGILEIADLFVINKAEREGADAVALSLEWMLELGTGSANRVLHHGTLLDAVEPDLPAAAAGWKPPICKTTAMNGVGIAELVAAIERHHDHLRQSGEWVRRERRRAAAEVEAILRQELLRLATARASREDLAALVAQVAGRQLDPYRAAQRLIVSLSP